MSNTYNSITTANTFGDWVATTNHLVFENNAFDQTRYIKRTGTLVLADTTLSLSCNSAALIQGQLQVQGVGSSAVIDNNLTVNYGQIYFSNTVLGLTNQGQAIINGQLTANGPDVGLYVANNTLINGYVTITGNTAINNTVFIYGNTVLANNLIVTKNFTSNNIQANTSINTAFLTVSSNANVASLITTGTTTLVGKSNTVNDLGVGGNFYVTGNEVVTGTTTLTGKANTVNDLGIGGNFYVTGNEVVTGTTTLTGKTTLIASSNTTNDLGIGNNLYVTGNEVVTGTTTLTGKANTVNDLGVGGNQYVTGTSTHTGKTTLIASSNTTNDLGIGGNQYVTGTSTHTGKTTLVASSNTTNDLGIGNNLYVTGNEVITGTTTLTGKANTVNDLGVGGNFYVTGNEVVTGTTTLTGKANTINDLGVGGNQYVTGNTVILGTLSVTGNTNLNLNEVVIGTITSSKANTTNDLGVGGNFYVTGNEVVTGTTTLTGKANTINDLGVGNNLYVTKNIYLTPASFINGDSATGGTTLYANSATIGSGGLSINGNFTINGTTVYNSPTFIISSSTPNPQYAYFGVYRSTNNSANANIRWNESAGYWDLTANSAITSPSQGYYRVLTNQHLSDSGTLANSTNVASSMALSTANTTLQYIITTANTNLKSYVDTNISYASGVDTTQNTNISYLIGALNQTNTNIVTANTNLKSYVDTNISYLIGALNQTNTNIVTANTNLKSYVDTNVSYISGVDVTQNTNISYLIGALNQTNTNIVTANTNLKSYSDSTFYAKTGGTISGSVSVSSDLTVAGNLTVTGTTTTVNTATITTKESLIKLADGNSSDALDIGFYGQYNSTGTKFAGLFRKAADKFYLVKDLTTDPTANTVTFTTANRATIDASLTGGTVSGLSSAVATTDGGTGLTSFTSGGAVYATSTSALTTGTLPITSGGTGATSFTFGQRLVYDGSKLASRANTTTTVTGTLGTGATISSFTTNSYGEVTAYTASNISIAPSQINATIPNSGLTNSTISGVSLGSNLNALTINNGGAGVASGTTFNGSSAVTLSYNSIGASPLAGSSSLTTTGTITSGTWNGNTIGTGYGGTGLTSFTSGGAVYASSTSALTTGTLPVASGGTGVTSSTGSGSVVLATSPTLTTPILGTPQSGNLSNCTFPTLNQNTTGNASTASAAYGTSFYTTGGGSENQIGVNLSGYNSVYLYSNATAWGLYSASGGSIINYTRSSGVVTTAALTNTQTSSLGVGTAATGTVGEIRATNNITAYYNASDKRLKENLVPLTGVLDNLDHISAYNFNYITRPNQKMVGVVAQELMEVYPELVYETKPIDEGTGLDKIYAVNYELLSSVLLQAVKELKTEVEELKKKVN